MHSKLVLGSSIRHHERGVIHGALGGSVQAGDHPKLACIVQGGLLAG